MIKIFQLFVLIILCTSCSTEADLPENNPYTGKWNLVKMTGSVQGSETTGSEMAWQEFYILYSNGTFTKKRVEMNFITELQGTYQIYNSSTTSNPGEESFNFIKLNYSFPNNIIATCSPNQLQENLYFTSTSTMKSTYHHCDSPGLEYEKVK